MRGRIVVLTVSALAALTAGLLAGSALDPSSRSADSVDVTCPTADDVQYDLTSSLAVTRSDITSSARMTLRATHLSPPAPVGGERIRYDQAGEARERYDALDGEVSARLSDCLVGVDAKLREYSWSDGTGTFVLDLPVQRFLGGPFEAVDGGILLDLRGDDSAFTVDVCPRRDVPLPLACQADRTSVRVAVDDESQQIFGLVRSVQPQPDERSLADDGAVTFTWLTSAPAPPAKIALRTSWTSRATSWLGSSAGTVRSPSVRAGSAELSLTVFLPSVIFLAGAVLLTSVLALVTRTGAAVAIAFAYLCLPLAVGVVRLEPHGLTDFLVWPAAAQTGAWALIALATFRTGSSRRTALALGLTVLTLGGLTSAALVTAADGRDLAASVSPSALSGVALTLATVAGVTGMVGRAWALRLLLPPGFRLGRRTFNAALAITVLVTVCFALGVMVGSSLGSWSHPTDRFDSRAATLLNAADFMSSSLGFSAGSLAPLLVAATISATATRQGRRSQALTPPRTVVSAAALALVTANTVGGLNRYVFGIEVPLWLVGWVAVQSPLLRLRDRAPNSAATSHEASAATPATHGWRTALLDDALAEETGRATVAELDKSVDGRTKHMGSLLKARATAAADIRRGSGQRLFDWGSTGWWLRNAQRAGLIGATVALVPVGYFAFTAVDVSSVSAGNTPLVLFVAIAAEIVRWLVPAFLLGMLYGVLPGQTGPIKALALTAVWFVGTAASVLAGTVLGLGAPAELAYRSFQLLVYLQVVAVLYDLATIRLAGGGWRQLRALYSLQNYTDLGTSLIPVVLAGIGLAQQLATGSGFDVAQAALNGISSVISSGPR